ncbi:selenoprotein S-like [Lineus longissimus]|uniref:selenoprotein S-like n=1 Tax=Lineus longissimus TaxID=88925 RepID=UPI002B4DC607
MEQPGSGGAAGEGPQAQTGFHQASNMAFVLEFMQSYGWVIMIAGIVAYFIYKKVQERTGRSGPNREGLEYDADTAFRRQEAMERVRLKWQQEHDANAAKAEEAKKLKEEQKRHERIEDWERHQEGRGYRSKVYTPKEEEAATGSTKPKPKGKPLRSPDYNPLMGDGGSCAWRPARSGGGGGG